MFANRPKEVLYDINELKNGQFEVSRWRDWIVPEQSMRTTAGMVPDIVSFIGSIEKYTFDGGSTTEELQGAIEINHEYKENTVIKPHIHWAPSNTNAGNVKWQLGYSIHRVGEAPSAEVVISFVQASNLLSKGHQIAGLPDIDGTNLQIGDYIHFRIFRIPTDAQDTYGSDAFLIGIGVHYEVDSTGSTQVFIK